MPQIVQPPEQDISRINFVVAMVLNGCVPPFWLMVRTAREPLGQLALIVFAPDAFDIAQALAAPSRGRGRRPARRGRKRLPRLAFPDVSDVIGGKWRREAGIISGVTFGPSRYAFPLLNVYEGLRLFVAVVELGSEATWLATHGVFSIENGICAEFGRFSRRNDGEFGMGWTGVSPWPISLDILDYEHGFNSDHLSCLATEGRSSVTMNLTVAPNIVSGTSSGFGRLRNVVTGETANTDDWDGGGGEEKQLAATIETNSGQGITWEWIVGHGVTDCISCSILGFETPPGFWEPDF